MTSYDHLIGMDEILTDFVIETQELLEQADDDLLALENDPDQETINRIFRVFHTIKGTSSFLSFDNCMELAHKAEHVLDKIRNDELIPTTSIVDTLLNTVDWFRGFIDAVQHRSDHNEPIEDLIEEINSHSGVDDEPISGDSSAMSSGGGEVTGEAVKINLPKELVEEFLNESQEQLEFLTADLLSLEMERENEELITNLFRAFHSLKGNSGFLGLDQFSKVAHKAEDILGAVRDKEIDPDSDLIDSLLTGVDWMTSILDEVAEGTVPFHNIDEIMDGLGKILGETPQKQKQEEIQEEKTEEKVAPGVEVSKPKKRMEQTIRVDVARLDKLMNLAGELVLEKNRLLQVSKDLEKKYAGEQEVGDLDGVNNSLGYITTEIQESIMQMRMLPISTVFRKFPRLIRDLARAKGKEIKLDLSGESTELDRSVIEAMGDPLVHLLRNAVDHGIETPETRIENEKDRQGTIALNAFQEGNHIVITISDDGGGIDPEIIKARAIEKEILDELHTNEISERDIINLIFRAGFSTAEKVTDVSGRGVGLDVVHSNIAKLSGTVEIDSTIGKGTIFTVKLPLTLTIISGMVVESFEEQYIIPITSISETMKWDSNIVSTVKGREVIRLLDSVLPLVRLNRIFNVEGNEKEQEMYIVMVAVAERRMGLVVSGLIGQEETVVKPLGSAMGNTDHVAGATIRGDGRVTLILDIPEIMNSQIG